MSDQEHQQTAHDEGEYREGEEYHHHEEDGASTYAEGGDEYNHQTHHYDEHEPYYGEAAEKVRAIYDYTAENDEQLSFKVGDLITVLEEREGGWWKGSLEDKEGLFPANYVEYLAEEGQEVDEEEEVGEEEAALEGEEIDAGPAGGQTDGAAAAKMAGGEQAAMTPADEREERRRRRQLDLDELEAQIERNKEQKAALEMELEQLKRVKEHAQQELTDMGLVRTDIELLVYDLVKIMGELDEESVTMNDLQVARQTLQAELNNFSALTSSEIKKGSPLEPFKTEILSKLAQLTLKLADDDKFIGIYEKKKSTFFFILKAVKDALQNK